VVVGAQAIVMLWNNSLGEWEGGGRSVRHEEMGRLTGVLAVRRGEHWETRASVSFGAT